MCAERLADAPFFTHTNGAALHAEGDKRGVTTAPDVRTVRLWVRNPDDDMGAICLYRGCDATQSARPCVPVAAA